LAQLGDGPMGLPASPAAASSAAAKADAPAATPEETPEPVATTGDGIGAIVRRIAAYRRNRDVVAANDAPQLPLSPE
ncbi:hypothetical protein U8M34_28690, partial [Klebsiella pneumoniae]|nr:hypothetical protein [Klebsiella pneumoniae]